MSNKTRSILGTAFVLIITFCAIFIVNKKTRGLGWIDTTENKLYTLTDGTKSILDKLDQKVTVKLFYAQEAANRTNYDQLLAYNNHYFYVRDLLRAYERYAGPKLEVIELDPRPYSDAEAEADAAQLQRIPISEREGYYFGLTVASSAGGSRQVIKWLDPSEQALLEYRISEAIDLSTKTKKDKLGVLASISVTGGGMSDYMRQMMALQGRQAEQPWVISEHLRKQYEIVDVAADTDSIPADVDFLLVIHPKDLPEKTLYAIDQFVVKGGKAMVFVDPHLLSDRSGRDPTNPMGGGGSQASSLEKLLNAWGVSVEPGKFAGDLNYARRIQTNRFSPERVLFAGVQDFRDQAFNQDEVAVRGLKQVTMFFPGAIRKKDDAGTTITPLITTTQEGNVWEAQSYELGGPMGMDIGRLAGKFHKGVEKICVAARITGTLKSAFDSKPGSEQPPPANGESEKAEAAAIDTGDVKDDAASKDEGKEGDKVAEAAVDKSGGKADDAKPADGETAKADDKTDEPGSETGKADGKTDGDKTAAAEEGEKKDDHVKESASPNTVFVVADVDMLTDEAAYVQTFFGMTPANSNADFVFNCIEQMAGSTDLMNIRSRGPAARPMEAVLAIERAADMRTRDQVQRINAEIEKVRAELAELDSKATEKNVGMLQAEAIEKQRNLQAEIRKKEREIRALQEDKIAAVEALGAWWKNLTRGFIPLVVLAVGIALAIRRYNVRKLTVLGGVS